MKKAGLCALLAFALMLGGCHSAESSASEETTAAETTTAASEETTTLPEEPVVSYKDLACVEPDRCVERLFGEDDTYRVLSVPLPNDWHFQPTEQDGCYDVQREGKTIGFLCPLGEDLSAWKVLEQFSVTRNGVQLTVRIEQSPQDRQAAFRYSFLFCYELSGVEYTTELKVDYQEVSEFTLNKIKSATCTKPYTDEEVSGILSLPANRRSVLILGNSFIGSSQVGAILDEMCEANRKTLSVTAISRGMATVQTYAQDDHILSEIRSGQYGAVLQCGFYSSSEVDRLNAIAQACKASHTKLVVFPAHNESEGVAANACAQYDVISLNWKRELDDLIKLGVDRWDLCWDDAHDHSTTLAGYVGAHMIYRAIFDEFPTAAVQGTVQQSQVDAILGTYAEEGIKRDTPKQEIILLS